MITLNEIAEKAGVSRATVSYVVNGRHDQVSPETRERVLAIARRYDYQPNALVQALRTNRTKVLGVLIPSVEFTFFPQILNAIETAASERGYQILTCQTHSRADILEREVQMLRRRRVDGLILTPNYDNCEFYRRMSRHNVRMVFVDAWFPDLNIPYVASNDTPGAAAATRYLIELGHRRIACLTGAGVDVHAGSRQRLAGYRQALEEAGLDLAPELIEDSGMAVKGGYRAVRRLLDRTHFTAVVTPTDMAAIGVLKALREAGLSCPEDVSIAGYGNLHEGEYLTPPLTTVDQKAEEMGRRAVEMVDALIEGRGTSPPKSYLTAPELVIRESCAALRFEARRCGTGWTTPEETEKKEANERVEFAHAET